MASSDAIINVRITAKDEVTPVLKNLEGAVANLSKSFSGMSAGKLTQGMQGLTGFSQSIQNLGTSLSSISTSFGSIGGKITEAGGALKAFAESSAGLAVTLGAGLGVAIGAISLGLGKLSLDLMKFAGSEEKAVAQTKHTLDQLGKSTEFDTTMKNIAKYESESRFESEELNKSFVQLLTTTKDTAKANDWLGLSMDIASKKGLDLYQVTKTLSKVIAGETRVGTLSALGIDIDDDALDKFKTNAEKAKYLYDQLLGTFKGSYKVERDTGSGALENITKQIDNLKEKLGLALLTGFKPLIEQFGQVFSQIMSSEGFNTFVSSISELTGALSSAVISAGDLALEIMGFENLGEFVEGLSGAFEKLAGFLDGIKSKIEDVKSVLEDFKSSLRDIRQTFSSMDYDKAGGVWNDSTGSITPFSQRYDPFDPTTWVSVNDALITKDGKVIQFNDNDNILAFQNLGGVGGNINMVTFSKAVKENGEILDETNSKLKYFNVFIEQLSNTFQNLKGYMGFGSERISNEDYQKQQQEQTSGNAFPRAFIGDSCSAGMKTFTVNTGESEQSYRIGNNMQPTDIWYAGSTWDERYQEARNKGMSIESASQWAGGRTANTMGDYGTLLKEQLAEGKSLSDARTYAKENAGKFLNWEKSDINPWLVEITGKSTDQTDALRNKYLDPKLRPEYARDAYLRAFDPVKESFKAQYENVMTSGDTAVTNLAYLYADFNDGAGATFIPTAPEFKPRWKICNECGTKNEPNSIYCKNPNCYYRNHPNNSRWTYEEKPADWESSFMASAMGTGAMSRDSTVSWSFNDVLITKKGDFVQFHPDDNIIATKDGFKSKQEINLTFNVYESSNPREVVQMIMKEINRVVRIG